MHKMHALGCHLQYCANRNVFNCLLKVQDHADFQVNLFQMVGPATASESFFLYRIPLSLA